MGPKTVATVANFNGGKTGHENDGVGTRAVATGANLKAGKTVQVEKFCWDENGSYLKKTPVKESCVKEEYFLRTVNG